jgi:hypothetical protein
LKIRLYFDLLYRGVVRQNGLQDAPLQMMNYAASTQHAAATCELFCYGHFLLHFAIAVYNN